MYSTSCQNFIENEPELSPAILVFCGHPVPHMEMGQPPMNQTSLRLQLKLFLNEFMTRCMRFINSNRKVPPPPLYLFIFREYLAILFRKNCSEKVGCLYLTKKNMPGRGGHVVVFVHMSSTLRSLDLSLDALAR